MTCRALEDDAAYGPHVHRALLAAAFTLDRLGREVHGRAGERVGVGRTGLAQRRTAVAHPRPGRERLLVLGEDFGGTKVDILDCAVAVEQDVCEWVGVCSVPDRENKASGKRTYCRA